MGIAYRKSTSLSPSNGQYPVTSSAVNSTLAQPAADGYPDAEFPGSRQSGLKTPTSNWLKPTISSDAARYGARISLFNALNHQISARIHVERRQRDDSLLFRRHPTPSPNITVLDQTPMSTTRKPLRAGAVSHALYQQTESACGRAIFTRSKMAFAGLLYPLRSAGKA